MTASVRILVSVGTQFPFNRLIDMVDQWAKHNPDLCQNILMQTGPDGPPPKNTEFAKFLCPAEYKEALSTAELLITHAGIGSILSAIEVGLPVIIVPRSSDLGEHRNDHQTSTAREFAQRKGIYVARTQDELNHLLDIRSTLGAPESVDVDEAFIQRVDQFIQRGF